MTRSLTSASAPLYGDISRLTGHLLTPVMTSQAAAWLARHTTMTGAPQLRLNPINHPRIPYGVFRDPGWREQRFLLRFCWQQHYCCTALMPCGSPTILLPALQHGSGTVPCLTAEGARHSCHFHSCICDDCIPIVSTMAEAAPQANHQQGRASVGRHLACSGLPSSTGCRASYTPSPGGGCISSRLLTNSSRQQQMNHTAHTLSADAVEAHQANGVELVMATPVDSMRTADHGRLSMILRWLKFSVTMSLG